MLSTRFSHWMLTKKEDERNEKTSFFRSSYGVDSVSVGMSRNHVLDDARDSRTSGIVSFYLETMNNIYKRMDSFLTRKSLILKLIKVWIIKSIGNTENVDFLFWSFFISLHCFVMNYQWLPVTCDLFSINWGSCWCFYYQKDFRHSSRNEYKRQDLKEQESQWFSKPQYSTHREKNHQHQSLMDFKSKIVLLLLLFFVVSHPPGSQVVAKKPKGGMMVIMMGGGGAGGGGGCNCGGGGGKGMMPMMMPMYPMGGDRR